MSTVTLAVSDGQLTGSATATVNVTVDVNGLESPLGALIPDPALPPPPTVSYNAGRNLPLKLRLACGTSLLGSDIQPPRLISLLWMGQPAEGEVAPLAATASPDSNGLFRFSDNAY